MWKYCIAVLALLSCGLLAAQTAGDEPAVRRMLALAEMGDKAVPHLKECEPLLKSSKPVERIAAMNVFISAGAEYPSIVPDLLKMIQSPGSGAPNDIALGAAVVTLLTVCNDENVFAELLKSPNKRIRMAMSNALLDSPRLTPKLREMLDWPSPDITGPNRSVIVNGGFEADAAAPSGWTFALKDGAEGDCAIDPQTARDGKQSLRIVKTNGQGYVELRSAEAVEVPAKAFWNWRGYYRADDCTGSSLLFFRLEDEKGEVSAHDDVPRAGWGWQSQAYLLNSPPGEWNRRVLGLRPAKEARKFHLVVRIYGNPVTVWLDDLSFPARPWKINHSPLIPEPPRYTLEEARAIIAKRPVASAKLEKNAAGKVELKINGETTPPVLYFPFRPGYGDFKLMEEAGIKLHNVIVKINDFDGINPRNPSELTDGPVWPSAANDNYNLNPLINEIREFVRRSPESYMILGINIHWPADYVANNPDTKWLNERGEAGYGNTLYMMGFKKEDQLPAGNTLWPSPYLDKPFEDVAKITRAFIRRLKAEGLDKVVVGAFASGGHDGQFEVLRRDYSEAGTAAWRQWLKTEYASDAALAKAWSDSQVTRDTAAVPVSRYENYDRRNSSSLYSPQTEQPDHDYEKFRQERTWKIKEYLVRAIKEEFDKPMLGITWLMGGSLSKYCKPLLESKDIDLVVTQPSYQNRRPGMPNGNVNSFDSFHANNKLWVLEMDLRSWLRETYYNEIGSMKIGTPLTPEEFRSTNRKLTGDFLAAGNGWWYFDISENAFSNPDILQEIKASVDTFKQVQARPQAFRPDMVIVTDSDAPNSARMTIHRFRNNLSWLLGYQGIAIATSGVPYDSYFLEDLIASPHGADYKVYVFMNSYKLTPAERKFIEEKLKRGGKTLIWLYAPDYLNGKFPSDASAVSSLTGMNVNMEIQPKDFEVYPATGHPLAQGLLPRQGYGDLFRLTQGADAIEALKVSRFTVDDPQAEVIARYAADNATATAVKRFPGWTSVYVTASSGLSPELLNNIAGQAGAYRLCAPNQVQTSMNGSFISAHAVRGGDVTFTLPYPARVTDIHTNKEVPVNGRTFTQPMKAGESRWFLLEPAAAQ
jgi:hypothetical protein